MVHIDGMSSSTSAIFRRQEDFPPAGFSEATVIAPTSPESYSSSFVLETQSWPSVSHQPSPSSSQTPSFFNPTTSVPQSAPGSTSRVSPIFALTILSVPTTLPLISAPENTSRFPTTLPSISGPAITSSSVTPLPHGSTTSDTTVTTTEFSVSPTSVPVQTSNDIRSNNNGRLAGIVGGAVLAAVITFALTGCLIWRRRWRRGGIARWMRQTHDPESERDVASSTLPDFPVTPFEQSERTGTQSMLKVAEVGETEVQEAERIADAEASEGTQLMHTTEGPEPNSINVLRERDERISVTSGEIPDSPPPAYEDLWTLRGSGASLDDI